MDSRKRNSNKSFLDLCFRAKQKRVETTINEYLEAVSGSNESVDEFLDQIFVEAQVDSNLNVNTDCLLSQNVISERNETLTNSPHSIELQLDVNCEEPVGSVQSPQEIIIEDLFLQAIQDSHELDYETDSEDSDCEDKGAILASKLRDMVRDGDLNVTVTSKLLKAVRDCDLDICLPKNYNELMDVPLVTKQPTKVTGGEYIHMGIQENFKHMNDRCILDMDEIEVDVSFDGIPCFSSSSKQVWVISAGIVNKRVEPLIVGVYVGESKPSNPGEFFYVTLHEIDQLRKTGVEVGAQKLKKPFKTRAMIGDTPARCLATGALGHSGKNSCPVCNQIAQRIGHYTVFSKFAGHLRTDETFRSREDPDYNK